MLAVSARCWAGSTLIVNASGDDNNTDEVLSIREALILGSRPITMPYIVSTAEKNQVVGGNFIPVGSGFWTADPINPNFGADFADDIRFTSNLDTILINGQLPRLGKNDDIDGDLGSGLKITLNGQNNATIGIEVNTGDSSGNQIRNLRLRNFGNGGINCRGVQGGVFEGLEIFNNGGDGLFLGGLDNGVGSGMRFNPRDNRVGGTQPQQRNYIYSNAGSGIVIDAGANFDRAGALGNIIANNYVGLKDAAGDFDNGNGNNGIALFHAFGNTIGGSASDSRNVVSGNNNDGIHLEGVGCSENLIVNNFVGLSASGHAKIGNSASGIALLDGAGENPNEFRTGNVIGGNDDQDNFIGGNNFGIFIANPNTAANKILGNFIGTNGFGENLGNSSAGIALYDSTANNVIDKTNIEFPVICFNAQGIDIANGASGNTIKSAFIGTHGITSQANGIGIRIFGGAHDNIIGEAGAANPNHISGNTGPGVGIYNAGSTGNKVLGNYIGVDEFSPSPVPNGSDGVVIQEGASGNEVRANVISGNGQSGVKINGDGTNTNTLIGNKIGTNIAGTAAVGNSVNGVLVAGGAKNNTIGGTTPYNIISGNANDGVQIRDPGTTGNTVVTSVIGLDINGAAKLANGQSGVSVLSGASDNTIGGAAFLLPLNFIAGNASYGVFISDMGTNSNHVFGCFIGLTLGSSGGFGNDGGGVGVFSFAAGSHIGDDGPLGNIISGNGGPGVDLGTAGFCVVQGNLIGTTPDGNGALPNSDGIRVFGGSTQNMIGGPNPGDKNTISGNASNGVGIYNSTTTFNTVQGNTIGTNSAGTASVPNALNGVLVQEGASENLIQSNVISGNAENGVRLNNAGTFENKVYGNKIGVAPNGTSPLANFGDGVLVSDLAVSSFIGTRLPSDQNTIAFNEGNGVTLTGGLGNLVNINSIHSNGRLGVDLGGDGVGLSMDTDTTPPLHSAAVYALLTSVQKSPSGGVRIKGVVDSTPDTTHSLDFYYNTGCDDSAYGEGETYIGSLLNFVTDADGHAEFDIELAVTFLPLNVTSLLTIPDLGTREFSACQRNAVRTWRQY